MLFSLGLSWFYLVLCNHSIYVLHLKFSSAESFWSEIVRIAHLSIFKSSIRCCTTLIKVRWWWHMLQIVWPLKVTFLDKPNTCPAWLGLLTSRFSRFCLMSLLHYGNQLPCRAAQVICLSRKARSAPTMRSESSVTGYLTELHGRQINWKATVWNCFCEPSIQYIYICNWKKAVRILFYYRTYCKQWETASVSICDLL